MIDTSERLLTTPPGLVRRRRLGRAFELLCLGTTVVGVVFLAIMLVDILIDGAGLLTVNFFSESPSSRSVLREAGPVVDPIGTVRISGLVSIK